MPTSLNKYLDPAGLDETVVNIRELIEGLEAEMQDLPYARPDGLYPDMTVGAVQGAPQTSQWATRESTGSGAATVRSVQGATIGYNQYQVDSYTISAYGLTVTVNNGLLTITGTPNTTTTAAFALMAGTGLQIPSGHKLLLYNTNNTLLMYVQGLSGYANYGHQFLTADDDTYGKLAFSVPVTEGQPVNISAHVMLFDLTQMFGSGNEPATVAEFERMFPASYYPYSEPTLKPVQIAGIASTDANGYALDGVEWTAQELWGITSAHTSTLRDELTADEVKHYIGVVDLGTLNWTYVTAYQSPYFSTPVTVIGAEISTDRAMIAGYESKRGFWGVTGSDMCVALGGTGLNVANSNYTNAAAFKAAMQGVLCAYALATPTTTPISPLPMTYRVKQGGTESIVVPDGEVSAAPLLTVKDPLNVAAEFERVWEAIEQLQSSSAAQLSRPVSLADAGSVDEVQNDTTEIETVKEVKE